MKKICLGISSLVLALSAGSANAIPAEGGNGSYFLGNEGFLTINAGSSIDNSWYLDYGDGKLVKVDATCRLRMQEDGNLVLSKTLDNSIIWQTNTSGNPGAYAAIKDDRLSIWDKADKRIWTTPSFRPVEIDPMGLRQAYFLGINEACGMRISNAAQVTNLDFRTNIVPEFRMYAGSTLLPGKYLEDPKHQYRLLMREDGNLVLIRNSDQVVVAQSGTGGNPGAYAAMQTDGNFVVYSKSGTALVSTGTGGQPYGFFVFTLTVDVTPTGAPSYLQIYTSSGFSYKLVWSLPPAMLSR